MKSNTTKRLCRAGVIAALYAALTYIFAPFAFGPLQIRPAEALCLLPLLFPEAIPALFVGCMLSNLPSPYFIYDVAFGSLATLISACGTYLVGRLLKGEGIKIFLGGLFPVLCNAFLLPVLLFFLGGEGGDVSLAAYFTFVATLALTESVWVYALGAPMYLGIKKRAKSTNPNP